jgi:hypothetical protein
MATSDISKSPLYIDSTNNRVGVGTASPATALDVTGDITATHLKIGTTANPSAGGVRVVTNVAGGSFAQYNDSQTNSGFTLGTIAGSGIFYTHTGAVGSETYTERMRISSGGIITYNNDPTSGGGVNVSLSASYNDTSNHTVGGVNTQSFALITINTSNGATHIPVYRNGGAGVAYGGTMLDPDNQTWVALGTSITFNQPGSFPQTFVVSITSGGSQLNVQRTSGSNAYSVYVQLLG